MSVAIFIASIYILYYVLKINDKLEKQFPDEGVTNENKSTD